MSNILPAPTGTATGSADSLFELPKVNPDELIDYSDYNSFRGVIYNNIKDAVSNAYPIANDKYKLVLSDVQYEPKERYNLREQREAILKGKSLVRKLKGSWEVHDLQGNILSKSNPRTVMNVPFLTDRGTFIRNGTEYTVNKQFRLNPGVYSQRTDDQQVEAQINVKPGTGSNFRIFMDPSTAVFYLKYANKKVPLLPVMEAMGYDTQDLKSRWGKEIYTVNETMRNTSHATRFIKSFVHPGGRAPKEEFIKEQEDPTLDKEAADDTERIRQNLIDTFSKGDLDVEGTTSTLGKPYERVQPQLLADATSKLLRISRGQEGNDNRDSLAFQRVFDFSDFLTEKIRRDQHNVSKKLLWRLSSKGPNAEVIPPAHLDDHVTYLFNNSGVSQGIEEINPLDYYDQNQRITRLGEGALEDIDSVPSSARDVQPSYLNFVDVIRSPESLKIGVDMRLARNVRKGKDNKLYTQFINARTGEREWVDSKTAAYKNVATSEYLNDKNEFVPAVTEKGVQLIPRKDLDFVVPTGDDIFSNGANTVPLKSGVKGMRLLMGSKFAVQALPLVSREAPLVRTVSGESSVEEELGTHMGALRADNDGVVTALDDDSVTVKYADGKSVTHELYNKFPFSRKTYIRNIPAVKVGDKVGKQQLLASSNYTDDKGVTALGTNLRVAYMNYDGKVFEDSILISESAARSKLTSEHMYNEEFEKNEDTQTGLKKFLAVFPSKFNKDQLNKLDENGVVKPGSILNYGDPMVVAFNETQGSNTLGRRLRTDITQTWTHKFPGVVTDATETKNGFAVAARANVPMMIADKLSNRFGGKGVISDIIPDDKMPRDSSGRPIDVIISPLGVISRTNSSQLVEAQLGKIAEKTGKPYTLPGFLDEDMVEFAEKELTKNGLKDVEDIYDPRTGKTIPGIFTGKSFFYKLQHTAEGKGKARSTGKYTEEGLPAKGGKTGCFPSTQKILTLHGEREIGRIVEKQQSEHVWTYDGETESWCYRPITDWFTYRARVSDILNIEVEGTASVCGGKRFKHTSVLTPTINHEVYLYNGKKVTAGELKVGDELISWGPIATDYQKKFLAGSLLGDAYLTSQQYQVMHSIKQSEYISFKQKVVAGLYGTWSQIKSEGIDPQGKSHKRTLMTMCDKAVIKELKQLCYKEDKKTVTEEWLNYIGDIGLCAWILDDGYIGNHAKKKGKIALQGELSTHGFSETELDLIIAFFERRFGDKCVSKIYKRPEQYSLYISAKLCSKLVELIAQYIPYTAVPRSKIWLRKTIKEIQKTIKPVPVDNICRIGKVPATIRSIKQYKHRTDVEYINVYDFTVDHTHKYTAGNVLVSNSKHLGVMEEQGLLGHNATKVLRDMKLIKGQRNDEFWKQLKLGYSPKVPDTPEVYNKFKAMLTAAGVNFHEGKDNDNIQALTNKGAQELTGDRQIVKNATFAQSNFKPIEGGLFDPVATDSLGNGKRWGYIALPEPMVNPVMEDPIRNILGMTRKQFDEEVRNGAINDKINKIDVEHEITKSIELIKNGNKTSRPLAIKKFRYLKAMQDQGVAPRDYLMDRIPVLPPKYRPITQSNGMNMVNDANYMYKATMEAIEDYKDAANLPDDVKNEARENIQKNYRALVGLTDPVQAELQTKQVGGILTNILGKGSPKLGFVQKRVIGTNIDASGLAVISLNPSLKLNQVGIPEEKAWDLYEPFIVRSLVQAGMPATEAAKAVANKTEAAQSGLRDVIKTRPVIVNRAPTLHKYSMIAMWPVITKGHSLQIPPALVKPLGADFDGDKQIGNVIVNLPCKYLEEYYSVSDIYNKEYWRTRLMAARFTTHLPYVKGSNYYCINLEDFPYRKDRLLGSKDGVDFYEAEKFLKVPAYCEKTKKIVLADVHGWSIHRDKEIWLVNLHNRNQIITDDDERAVYGCLPGTLELVRRTPKDSVGMLVPSGRHLENIALDYEASITTIPGEGSSLLDQIPLNKSFGHLIGFLIGDGWVSFCNGKVKGQLCFSTSYGNVEQSIQEDLNKIRKDGKAAHLHRKKTADSYGDSYTYVYSNTDTSRLLFKLMGKGADKKHLPSFWLCSPREFKIGLLSGLFDSDGSISISNGKSKPQLMTSFSSISLRLVQEVKQLLMSLGVSSRISYGKTTKCDNISWMLTISAVELIILRDELCIAHEDKHRKLFEVTPDNTAAAYIKSDLVPIERNLAAFLKLAEYNRSPKLKHGRQCTGLYHALADSNKSGYISRQSAQKCLDLIDSNTPADILEPFNNWKRIVEDTDTTWTYVVSVENTEKVETGYDLTVPGYETFMSVDGTILSNTMSYSVPVSEDAVQEAIDRMMPDKNLILSGTDKPTYMLGNEYLQGLYFASKDPDRNKQKTIFKTKDDAIKAFSKGLIKIDDPIEILDIKK